ncbi:hypothetical protein D3C72_1836160 [compost metagenome]
MGSSCPLVPTASRSLFMASRTFDVPMKARPSPSFSASTHQPCHRKPCRRRVPKSEIDSGSNRLNRSTLPHNLVLARAYSTSSSNRPNRRKARLLRNSLRMARAGISHSVTSAQGPANSSRNCPSAPRDRSYSGRR